MMLTTSKIWQKKNIIFHFLFLCQLKFSLSSTVLTLSLDAIFVLQRSKNVKKKKACNKFSVVHSTCLRSISVQLAEDVMKGETNLIFRIIAVSLFQSFLIADLCPILGDVALTAFNQDNI